jgi:lysophospholipase L1-like esterase
VDHLYGTIHEDNAEDYLTDNLHLNKAGRELVADRFVEALYYYNTED